MIMPCKNQTWIPSHATGAGVSDVTVCLPRKKKKKRKKMMQLEASLFSLAEQKKQSSSFMCVE